VQKPAKCGHGRAMWSLLITSITFSSCWRLVDRFYDAFSVTNIDYKVISERRWTGKHMVGSGRGIIFGTIPAFAYRDRGKPWKVVILLYHFSYYQLLKKDWPWSGTESSRTVARSIPGISLKRLRYISVKTADTVDTRWRYYSARNCYGVKSKNITGIIYKS
jgi:hypothetical protein